MLLYFQFVSQNHTIITCMAIYHADILLMQTSNTVNSSLFIAGKFFRPCPTNYNQTSINMTACLSTNNKRKRKNKSGNVNTNSNNNNNNHSLSFPNINGIKQNKQKHNKSKYKNKNQINKLQQNEETEWIQQQRLLLSRVHLKPNQYLILSQKDIHDTIDKILTKYPNKVIHWHWFNGRFEPVLDDNNNNNNIHNHPTMHSRNNTLDTNQYELGCIHHQHKNHNHNHNHLELNDHSSINTNNTTMTGKSNKSKKSKKHLLRMNGHYCIKCKSCFRKTMKREYMTQKDILFLIKYSLKFFIQYRGEYKHQCSWRHKLDQQQGIIYNLPFPQNRKTYTRHKNANVYR